MKTRLFIAVLLALGGAALWWYTRPATEAHSAEKVTEGATALEPAMPTLKPSQVAAPRVAPAMPKSMPGEAADAHDPREDPHTAILDMLRLLDAGDYHTYMNTYMTPFVLDQIDQYGGLDKFIKMDQGTQGVDRRLAHLKEALAAIKDATPVYKTYRHDPPIPDEVDAEFKLDPPISGMPVFSLVNINGLWYNGMGMLGWSGEDNLDVEPATLDDPKAMRKVLEQADAKSKALQEETQIQPMP